MGKKRRIITSTKFKRKYSTHPAAATVEEEIEEVTTKVIETVEELTPKVTMKPEVILPVPMKSVADIKIKEEKVLTPAVAKKVIKTTTTAKSSRPISRPKNRKTKTTSTKPR